MSRAHDNTTGDEQSGAPAHDLTMDAALALDLEKGKRAIIELVSSARTLPRTLEQRTRDERARRDASGNSGKNGHASEDGDDVEDLGGDALPPNGNGARAKSGNGDVRAEHASNDWVSKLTITDDGTAASAGNAELIFCNDPVWSGGLRYNARSNVIIVERSAPTNEGGAPCEYRDSDDARIAIWFERSEYKIRFSPSSAALRGAINVVAERSGYDPVRDWLDSLQWDGTPRLERFAIDYLGAADEAINRAYCRYWLISAVARVYEPGCQADYTLVLVGPQGKRKSSALRALATRAEWFTDSLPSLSDRKAAAEVLHGKWIVEHAELDQLGRAELSTAKAWLTAREDRYRAAYAKRADTHPRRCVFAASTNEDAFLKDASGGRRFWPMRIGTIDLGALERDVAQLWAEAVGLYRAGERWHLIDPTLVEAAADTQEGRYQIDAWEPLIANYLQLEKLTAAATAQRTATDPEPVRVTLADVLEGAIGMKPERWDQLAQNRVARCLQHLGWERRQRRDGAEESGGERARRWAYELAKEDDDA